MQEAMVFGRIYTSKAVKRLRELINAELILAELIIEKHFRTP